jgi:small-conductance mechanosensitive channel
LNLAVSPATSLAMKPLQVATTAPREIESVLDWLLANLDRLAIGAVVAAAIVGLMMVMRWIGQRIVAANPENFGWKGIVGRALARTSIFFMVAAAIDIVASYAAVPSKLARLADILFIVAAALQAAIWAREIVIGVIRHRVGEDPGATTLGNAMGIIRVLVSVAVFAIAIIVILDNLGVNVTALVAGLGIGGIAIGLAAQGIFSDLFAALSIVFDRPFRRGDLVRYDNTTGTVERIGLKTTRLRSLASACQWKRTWRCSTASPNLASRPQPAARAANSSAACWCRSAHQASISSWCGMTARRITTSSPRIARRS